MAASTNMVLLFLISKQLAHQSCLSGSPQLLKSHLCEKGKSWQVMASLVLDLTPLLLLEVNLP